MKNILSKILILDVLLALINMAYAGEIKQVKQLNVNPKVNKFGFMTMQDIADNGLSGISLSNTSVTTYNVALYIGTASTDASCDNMLDSWDAAVGVEIPYNGGINIPGNTSFNIGSNYLYNMVMNMLYQFNFVKGEPTPTDLTNYTPGNTANEGGTPGLWCIRIGLFANSASPSSGLYPVGATQGFTSSDVGQNEKLITSSLHAPNISITCEDSSLTCTADTIPTVENFPDFTP